MKIVLRIAGSVLGSPPNVSLVEAYTKAVLQLVSQGYRVAVVVGGGPVSREYVRTARDLGFTHTQQDAIGISILGANALLVAIKLGIAGPVPTTISGMMKRLRSSKVAVMGGLRPGMTTDTVAALVAEKWGADLILKGSDQEGIYTSDPRKNKNAKKLGRITHAEMARILGTKYVPGIHSIVDPVAVTRLRRSKIRLIVFKGTKPANALLAVRGARVGTEVVS